ncbi:MAG: FliA/WhiG family RNA polymerase sigma factor [Candidatus Aminicenantes bacterium]|nr:FliA/WhiG family RNA polymerase sigma factor [Candidatus Aminicenantes bacterium]NIM83568.1 FliA/WhiG family RNA polymerase sigma factor [Candidatus Aminicenantes bacterium]NIN22968.1 FliA/WhiG family RNA polymerase sigma factor [Candidatus Aminicenantes bacterium]NIN46705.1 FliA/WhiG family RNA polymerase sigma factor [Candidatus Aminicenantes bacterium]NIN89611.1 FliA/WhiG family RNA polymerase sigma factor [Candidatus Aminicenantes bacterium]
MNKQEFEKCVLDNLYIVKIIASKLYARIPSGIELEDLVHTGILGLIDAVRKYDPTKGTRFSTYASLRIKGAILDELRNLDWASRSLRRKIKEIEQAFEALEIKLDRPPKEEEVAESLGLPLSVFQKLLNESRGVGIGVFRIALEDETNISDEKMLNYYMDEDRSSPALFMEKSEMKDLIASFINELPQKEKLVLNLYHLEDLNLKEVGKIMALTESRISQIRTAAILRLRGKLADVARKNGVSTREVL